MALNSYSCNEVVPLIGELTQGLILAKELKAHTGSDVSTETEGMRLEGIISSLEKSLLILRWAEQSQQHMVPSTNMPGSSIPVIRSPKNEALNRDSNALHDSRDFSKKRKMMSSWIKPEKGSCSENGQDRPPDDGYSWRKYGQKDILGAKHPRSYYRCTYRNTQGCHATKQVQRNDEDPLVFKITYKGSHTCTPAPCTKPAPMSQVKHEQNKHHSIPNIEYQQQHSVKLNFHPGVENGIQNLENQERVFPFYKAGSGYENHLYRSSTNNDDSFYNSFQPLSVLSPVTSESNILSPSPCKMKIFGEFHHGQHSESDITEIISASTSRTNSPINGTNFPLDQLEFNSSFPYDSELFISQFLSS